MNIFTNSSIRLGDCRATFLSSNAFHPLTLKGAAGSKSSYQIPPLQLPSNHQQHKSRSISNIYCPLVLFRGQHEVALQLLRSQSDMVQVRLEEQASLAIARCQGRIYFSQLLLASGDPGRPT
jgi:hypothetical protein